tara:strand:- start:28 stop:651 length:624 start_codon:yes stop_codon:yes gene_type:complete
MGYGLTETMPLSTQKQHVDLFRKLLLRRRLLRDALPGPAYVPFCGDGDIAKELYSDRQVYAADLDTNRVENAQEAMPSAVVRQADCDGWPFADLGIPPFTVCDFDAYADPYASFRAFWHSAPKGSKMVLFFTDGHRQGINRAKRLIAPDGTHRKLDDVSERRKAYNFYFRNIVLPWFVQYVEPWKVSKTQSYLRGASMLYWGAVVEL